VTPPDDFDPPPPLQFSLRRMFQLTAVCAVLMGLIVAYLPLGLMATFGTAGFFFAWLATHLDASYSDAPAARITRLSVAWLGMLLIGLTPAPILMLAGQSLLTSLAFGGPGAFGGCACITLVDTESKLALGAIVSHIGFAALCAPACRHDSQWESIAVIYLILCAIATVLLAFLGVLRIAASG